MDIVNHTVLAWLEEDNQKLGHFRVRPLLRETGPVTPAEIGEWRDDGYIRVVPDKSEQRSFKDRMRGMGPFCVITLTGNLADKFKSNKNYAPSKGEKNRYIVYSRALSAMTDGPFFEVVAESALKKAATPQAYARLGGKIHGPVDRQTGLDAEGSRQLPPDDPRIFSVTLPDGTVRLFYWPAAEQPAEAPAPAAPETAVPEEEPLTAFDQIRALDRQMMRLVHEAEDPEKYKKPQDVIIPDDAGTPLYHAQVALEQPETKRNALAQAVENNRKTARAPEKPVEKKKAGKKQKAAHEPEKGAAPAGGAEDVLAAAWADEAGRGALIKRLLALPGAREQMAQALGGSEDPVLAALRAQLQDTEAERLMTVMNLNRAKAQEAQYRDALIAGLVRSEREEIDRLREEAGQAAEALEALKAQRNALLDEQDRLVKTLDRPVVCAPQAADDAPLATVIRRVRENLSAAGFDCESNRAAALLVACVQNGASGVRVSSDCPADHVLAASALTSALGGVLARREEQPRLIQGGDGVLLLACCVDRPDSRACVNLLLDLPESPAQVAPILPLRQSGDLPRPISQGPAVSWAALVRQVEAARTPLNEKARSLIEQLRRQCAEAGCRLPLSVVMAMIPFMEAAQNLMEGGVTAALDWAVLLYALPAIGAEKAAFLRDFCHALPLSAACLGLEA